MALSDEPFSNAIAVSWSALQGDDGVRLFGRNSRDVPELPSRRFLLSDVIPGEVVSFDFAALSAAERQTLGDACLSAAQAEYRKRKTEDASAAEARAAEDARNAEVAKDAAEARGLGLAVPAAFQRMSTQERRRYIQLAPKKWLDMTADEQDEWKRLLAK